MKLSQAAVTMLSAVAKFDRMKATAPCRVVDYRVLPMLVEKGYIATNYHHGVCLTPEGRAMWEMHALGQSQQEK